MACADETNVDVDDQADESWVTATVDRDDDGNALGAVLFLSEADLDALSVVESDAIEYRVQDGELQLRSP